MTLVALWAAGNASACPACRLNACAGLTGCTTGTHDFFGNQVPLGSAFDIGADEAG